MMVRGREQASRPFSQMTYMPHPFTSRPRSDILRPRDFRERAQIAGASSEFNSMIPGHPTSPILPTNFGANSDRQGGNNATSPRGNSRSCTGMGTQLSNQSSAEASTTPSFSNNPSRSSPLFNGLEGFRRADQALLDPSARVGSSNLPWTGGSTSDGFGRPYTPGTEPSTGEFVSSSNFPQTGGSTTDIFGFPTQVARRRGTSQGNPYTPGTGPSTSGSSNQPTDWNGRC